MSQPSVGSSSWSWLNNPWLIGIVTGIIVWAVTWIITRLVLSKKEDREYAQKLSTANREVIIAIRPGIAEGQIPTTEILQAMVKATARRYAVASPDMYNPEELSEELVKEVMDSSFLSSAQKAEYCGKLLPSKTVVPKVTAKAKRVREDDESSRTAARYRSRMVEMLSLMLSLSTGVITAFLAVREVPSRLIGNINLRALTTVFIPVGVTLVMVALVAIYRDLRSIPYRVREIKYGRERIDALRQRTEQRRGSKP